MKKIMLLILLASAILLYAQEKKLSIEDIVINSYSELKPKSLSKLKWMPEKSVYTYIEEDEDNFYLVQGSRSGKKEIVTGSKKINAELKEYDKQIIKSFPDYEWVTDNDFNFWLDNSYFRYNVSDGELGKLFELPESTSEINVAPNYKYAAYLDNENLFIQNDDEKIFQVTTDGARDYTYGQSVSRNEFGIKKGMFWSPNGKLLAFYKEDLREITDYPLLDTEPVPAKTHLIKYPMAGQNSSQVSIGIYDLLTEKIIWLKTEMQKDQYLTCVTWGPESRLIYVAHLNRDQNYMQLFKYDANTGERLNKILEERNDVFVEPENEMIFLPKDKNSFIWQSEKDGFNHLYLYSVDGEFKKQITKGQWEVTEVNGFDNSGELVFFTSTEESPLERHVYKQNIKLGDKMKLTIDQGTHKAKFHNNSYYFIDSFTNYDTPNQHRLINVKGEIESLIFDAPNPLSDYKSCEQKIFTLSAGDGTELYSRIIFPPDFDENKKYPAILYVYGGPHDQQITNSWQGGKYNLWFYRMAQEGYITFMLDNRGTAHRGLTFEQATFRKLGTIEIEDQMKGVEYLKSLKYIDGSRLGVYGWSYGGFMATSLMLRTDNTFKVGVAGGAVIDWAMYEVMYTERYMDTPQTNPTGYSESNLLNYVGNLNGKLLLVHGTNDPTVVWQNTLKFVQKAVQLNKPLDYYPYVGWTHHVRGNDAKHLYEKITNYFLDNL